MKGRFSIANPASSAVYVAQRFDFAPVRFFVLDCLDGMFELKNVCLGAGVDLTDIRMQLRQLRTCHEIVADRFRLLMVLRIRVAVIHEVAFITASLEGAGSRPGARWQVLECGFGSSA